MAIDPSGWRDGWEAIFHLGDLSILAGMAWRVIRAADRVINVLKDFPPHRHEANGVIRYPRDFDPGQTERF